MALYQHAENIDGNNFVLMRPTTFLEALKLGCYLWKYPGRSSVLIKPSQRWFEDNLIEIAPGSKGDVRED